MHNVSFTVDDAGYEMLEDMAKANHKSKTEILREAIETKAAFEKYEYEQVMVGLRQADNGEVISHKEMLDFVEGLNDET